MIPHARMAPTLAGAQVYVSTSLSDSTSVSLLEAMAAGAFPVVTDIEANREWIEDGRNGFLVPVDDPAVLASRIIAALADPELRRRARAHNLELVRRRASWRANMDAIERLFRRLVAGDGPAAVAAAVDGDAPPGTEVDASPHGSGTEAPR
jgi:glycosyltransferase involved in cell wall biosynthesis